MTKRDTLNYLLLRIQDINRIFGTVTDIHKMAQLFLEYPQLQTPALSDADIVNFRRIVETGILKNPIFRPPVGHDVLGFLIALKDIQDRQLQSQIRAQDDEFAGLIADRIFSMFSANNGDLEAVVENIRDKFSKFNGYSQALINRAYSIAKNKWETHVTAN